MKHIVCIGGGKGTSTILSALKTHDQYKLSAIIASFDSGGSGGKVRYDLNMIPPGDFRDNLFALSSRDDPLQDIFLYRFANCAENHSLGNLIVAAAVKHYGSFEAGLAKLEELFKCKGTIIPVSLELSELCAKLSDGTIIESETNIDVASPNRAPIESVFLKPEVSLNFRAKTALETADLIILGPGDLYTSVIPNLLVTGMKEALAQSSAKILYICNIKEKQGETQGFSSSDFKRIIQQYLGKELDYLLLNATHASEPGFVSLDLSKSESVIIQDLSNPQKPSSHDPFKVLEVIKKLC